MKSSVLIISDESIKRKSTKEIRKEKFSLMNKLYNLAYRVKRKIKTKLGLTNEDTTTLENKWL